MVKAKKKQEEPALRVLQAQTVGYERAEISLLVAEKTASKDYFNLLTLIELMPAEQAPSAEVGEGRFLRVHRANIADYTFYVVRITDLTVEEALQIYIDAPNGLKLPRTDVPPSIAIRGDLTPNPPAYRPILITETDRQLYPILPHRHTAMRVWSFLNMDKDWLSGFDEPFMRKVSELSKKFLGYDLKAIPEHFGNVYLFGCNPLLRSWECRLADYDKELLFRFNERSCRRISGCKLVLEEVRGDQGGFYLEQQMDKPDMLITLPYFPDQLHIRLFDADGYWIDHSYSGWVNFVFNMTIHDRVVDYRIQTENGLRVFSVPKKLSERRVSAGTYDFTAAHYLRDALAGRRFEDLAKNKEFIFFPKNADSLVRAQEAIRELLNSARQRCIILDPYFGAVDMLYIYQIENITLTVRVISSAAYLNDRPKPPKRPELPGWRGRWQRLKKAWRGKSVNTAKPYLENLYTQLTEYAQVMPLQKIECRVLRGEKSPLHDRFLVIDDNVYLLGSSLNEFGNRTTTISRVPAPGEMIDQAERWWADEKACPAIADFVAERRSGDVEV